MSESLPISPVTGRPMKSPPHKHSGRCKTCSGKDPANCPACKGTGFQPFRKCTFKEKEQRIEQLASVIGKASDCLKKHEVRAFCEQEWGLLYRQADRYLTCARELLMKRANRPKDEFKAAAISFNEEIIRNPRSQTREKADAQRELNRLLGLYAPVGMRIADEQGKPLAAVVAPVVNFIMPDNGRGPGLAESLKGTAGEKR